MNQHKPRFSEYHFVKRQSRTTASGRSSRHLHVETLESRLLLSAVPGGSNAVSADDIPAALRINESPDVSIFEGKISEHIPQQEFQIMEAAMSPWISLHVGGQIKLRESTGDIILRVRSADEIAWSITTNGNNVLQKMDCPAVYFATDTANVYQLAFLNTRELYFNGGYHNVEEWYCVTLNFNTGRYSSTYEKYEEATPVYGSGTFEISETGVNAPLAPTGFSGTAVSTTSIRLSWNSQSSANSYLIDRYITYTGSLAYMTGWSKVTECTGASYTVNGLTPNSSYKFRIRAVNEGGTSSEAVATVSTGESLEMYSVSLDTNSPLEGSTISVSAMNPAAATVTYQWYKGSSSNSVTTKIDGATDCCYTPISSDVGYYLKCAVSGYGQYSGSVEKQPIIPFRGCRQMPPFTNACVLEHIPTSISMIKVS